MKLKGILCAVLALFIIFGCTPVQQPQQEEPQPPVQDQPVTPDPQPEPQPEPEPQPIEIRIVAAGDNLLHNTISFNAETAEGYDFSPIYTQIAPITEGSDIAFINQEVMLTGEVSGYPILAAPAEAADALLGAGFNVMNLATNHTLDKGVSGLEACLENVAQRDFEAVLGAFATPEEAETMTILDKQGVRIGFLSYTYGLNGYSLPEGREYMVALIDEAKITADIAVIRPRCDYLIVSMHWGNEYQHQPSDYQRQLAQLLCDNGVDLIIGTHPHVLQPMEWLENAEGGKTLCAYSLGNFVSNQHKIATMVGGMLDVTLKFSPEGELLETVSAGVIPTVTHYLNKGGYAIYPLSQYTDELAQQHGIKNHDKAMTVEYAQQLAEQVLGEAEKAW